MNIANTATAKRKKRNNVNTKEIEYNLGCGPFAQWQNWTFAQNCGSGKPMFGIIWQSHKERDFLLRWPGTRDWIVQRPKISALSIHHKKGFLQQQMGGMQRPSYRHYAESKLEVFIESLSSDIGNSIEEREERL